MIDTAIGLSAPAGGQTDDANKPAVSVWGKNVVAGDSALLATPAGLIRPAMVAATSVTDGTALAVGPVVDALDIARLPAEAPYLYDERLAVWDRARGNYRINALPSAARTAATSSPSRKTYNARALRAFLFVVTNPGGGETLQMAIRDSLSGYITALSVASAFAGGQGATILSIGPGCTAINPATAIPGYSTFGDATFASPCPQGFFIYVLPSGAGSWTYQVDVEHLV